MARKKSSSGPKKNDLKVTAIMVLCVMVAVVAFLIFNNRQKEENSPVVKKQKIESVEKSGVKSVQSKLPVALPVVKPIEKKVKLAPVPEPGSAGKIAFIIDDWGQSMQNCKYLKEIEVPIAVAILPSLRHSNDVSKCARLYNKTPMLHLPLQAYHNNDPYPPDYIIKTDMKAAKVETLLNNILEKMPYIEGVNNHMGSKATEDETLMRIILRRLKKKGYFFVDSMTAPNHSVCHEIAKELQIPFTRRDVFLDNINTRDEIIKQFKVLAEKARENGEAVAIGHDRPLTMQVLKEQILWLKSQGFTIVNIKDFLKTE